MSATPGIADSKCVLVIGATAGIGRALAASIHSLPSKPTVVVSGRRQQRLDELCKTGLETIQFDANTDAKSLKAFVDDLLERYPQLDTIVFSAAVQQEFDFAKPETIDLKKFYSELNLNYVMIVTLITYLLPHFFKLGEQGQPCFIVPITSNLGIAPGAWTPCYSATKAALHSLSLSLNEQLKDTNVHIMEIMPPLVESELHDTAGNTGKVAKYWMPLEMFVHDVMEGLKRGDRTIAVGLSREQYERFEKGKEDVVHQTMEVWKTW
ncbi:NAD P-binding protein [Gloeophyllum trabeum ATCC 11539]|uniref:NAD P-binding protein n=1 Tax=Gloeophyllum trabeum (strain ATCC 11539 / FP-39264 / Madison 617) TaxID=670483 RepID=S7QMV1_GLOTA|nr:NAD P-binding protein [Gloeophyllum trabeum ATCC 11539]EPQ60886.1 NAD P-binding protein [Gloeophyllum trabeum ATCC 11539]